MTTNVNSGSSPTPFPSLPGADTPNNQYPLIKLSAQLPQLRLPRYVIGTEQPYKLQERDQIAVEQLLLALPTCDPFYLSDISPRTYQLNIDKHTIPQELVYDSNYQYEVQCTVSGMTDVETKYLRYKLKNSITHIRKISAGNYSAAYEIFVRNYPWFVIKAIETRSTDTEWNIMNNIQGLQHGAVVGLWAINKLRPIIPTFMHTYGIFKCGMSVAENPKDSTKNTTSNTTNTTTSLKVCDPKGRTVPYVILENIRDSVPVQQFCVSDQCTVQTLASIFLQVVSGIRLGHRVCDLTHYDLNLSNVLVETSKTPIGIALTGETPNSPVRYHRTTTVARIIDYDMTHVVVGDFHLGVLSDLSEYGIDSHRSHPGYDIIKFITLTAHLLDKVHRHRPVLHFYQKWKFLTLLYDAIQFSLTLEQRVALYEINGIPRNVLDFVGVKSHPAEDYGQGLARNQIFEADDLIYKVQQLCEDNLGTEISDTLPAGTINTTNVPHGLMGWKDYTTMILDERRLPEAIVDYMLAVNATKRYTTGQHQADVLNWLGQMNYQQVFNQEYQAFYQEIINVQAMVLQTGISPDVTEYVNDLVERGSIWIEAVQATAPSTLLEKIDSNYIPGLKDHFTNLTSMLKELGSGINSLPNSPVATPATTSTTTSADTTPMSTPATIPKLPVLSGLKGYDE